jgi:hypothetical protein
MEDQEKKYRHSPNFDAVEYVETNGGGYCTMKKT